ncbi:MotA/TolQ/ExbB proton channel family protein [Acinetobacter sp. IK22]|uniref:MotA/TolQ/ExbB proton channel family protein n=1 Tax=unclassified Acinetobacter TaxID=196816 RepID=UPI002D1ED8AC|nr:MULTISPECIES: MotA/TolQ/ExbB proton channel family protein [unclassified Acinetobacter]MEB3794284.1 MotA/TolQ/ExbB proton channel family protein [Acinetobacter sp. IK24]MEB3813440.1 MotA/TolQ/ExbB proton channel family protein [Acinetobacter sp. IK22]MEB3832437.1 MotA/TolQ/ExbB proton channel family protein [Acinetobacter sp. IK23]
MWELVKAGGWLMLPLILCSILTVAISIERFIRLRRSQVLPKLLMSDGSADVSHIITSLEQDTAAQNTALGNILKAGFEHHEHGEQFARAQMEAIASQEISYLEKNINFLGTLSAIAPLLGLLGTVVGIIESFLVIDFGSAGSPSLMIPGISKALITTAVGMLIAIPALISYRYFQRVVQNYIAELEQQSTLFHASLFYKRSSVAQEHRRVG